MTINSNTKIASILKFNPNALDAIVSISPVFNKLRNPLLRKIMASRASIYTASKVAGCSVGDFFEKLQPLGFSVDEAAGTEKAEKQITEPAFMKDVNARIVEVLDVRPVIENGEDPFNTIMKKIKRLPAKSVLKLVNTFEPVPLINILTKQGYEYYIEHESGNLVNTFFYKNGKGTKVEKLKQTNIADWDKTLEQFKNNIEIIDVRHLEMPQPMMAILAALEKLPAEKALFVYHKRIPVFLLPELKDRKLDYRLKEIGENEVHLLIFYSQN